MQVFYNVCLNNYVVMVARNALTDVMGYHRQVVPDPNKTIRHVEYLFFTYWRCGYLGSDNRMVIPLCCVWRIRDKWPDARGILVDFISRTLAITLKLHSKYHDCLCFYTLYKTRSTRGYDH